MGEIRASDSQIKRGGDLTYFGPPGHSEGRRPRNLPCCFRRMQAEQIPRGKSSVQNDARDAVVRLLMASSGQASGQNERLPLATRNHGSMNGGGRRWRKGNRGANAQIDSGALVWVPRYRFGQETVGIDRGISEDAHDGARRIDLCGSSRDPGGKVEGVINAVIQDETMLHKIAAEETGGDVAPVAQPSANRAHKGRARHIEGD